MKASSNLLMRAAAMLLAVSACVALSACTKLPNSSQPTPAPTPIATAEPSTTPVLTEEEKQALYDEYFAEEREFVKSSPIADGFEITAYAPTMMTNVNGEIQFFATESHLIGYLYKINFNTNEIVRNSNIYVNERTNVATVGNDVYALQDENKIIKCDKNFENIETLYQTDKKLYSISTDGEILYFTEDNTICQMHIPSGKIDRLYTAEKPIQLGVEGVSNYKVRFFIHSDEYDEYLKTEDYQKFLETNDPEYMFPEHIIKFMPYIYDSQTNQATYNERHFDNVGETVSIDGPITLQTE